MVFVHPTSLNNVPEGRNMLPRGSNACEAVVLPRRSMYAIYAYIGVVWGANGIHGVFGFYIRSCSVRPRADSPFQPPSDCQQRLNEPN